MNKRIRNPYNWYLGMLGALSLLPILAPIFMKLGEQSAILLAPAKLIYFIYSFTCHQFASRSIHLFDYQIAWCARDTGIWLGLFIAGLAIRRFKLKGIALYWVLPFIIPIAMDGGIQTITTALNIAPVGIAGDAAYISTNVIRFLTGTLFGVGVSMWLSPLLADSFDERYQKWVKDGVLRTGWYQAKVIAATVAVMFVFYIGLVAAWNATSPKNPPTDWLDGAVKTPAVDFYVRRQDGICPTTATDLFNTDCFLGK